MNRSGLSIHTSNRLEVLVQHLAGVLGHEAISPLERELIVVQSQGMSRWLALELAERQGLAAGLAMPFPATFCTALADRLLDNGPGWAGGDDPSQTATSLFDRELLTWRIFHRLPEVLSGLEEVPEEASPAAYLEHDRDLVKLYQLSAQLASLFDDYQLFRPEMLLAWESEAPRSSRQPDPTMASWQARLWRSLTHEALLSEPPLARRWTRLRDHLRSTTTPPASLPRRLTVFGVATLPPIFLEIAVALARFIPVRIYFTSPTYLYWGDVRSDREAASLRRRLRTPERAAGDDHLERGHTLLASFGRQGRDFFNLLQDADIVGDAWHELEFVDPGETCLLHAVQSDILHMIDRGVDEAPARKLAADDDSLSVHACHSPRREFEILRDQLLATFDRDPDLAPSDVLIMVPDIPAYSPYVEAVFGVEWEGTPKLPYAIADRRSTRERPTAEVILQVLKLVAGRLIPRDVLDLLESPAVRRAFHIPAGEVPTLRQWVREAQIRWGMDGTQRARDFSLPSHEANTWQSGLDRLLMGYATGEFGQLVGGVAPCAGTTAGNAELLGRLSAFIETLFDHLRRLRDPRPADIWAADLGTALNALCEAESEEEEAALEWVREALDGLAQARRLAGLGTHLSLAVIRSYLEQRLRVESFGSGFISGRITVAALKPMRTLPFKVICIAGLNDGAFPRRDVRHSFDLMAQQPRLGDRSLREDDRYLFLETLLAADRKLILTYQGRSEKDNRQQAPAVVVSELLDYLDRAFATEDGRPTREQVVVTHRLHPFSPDYYGVGDDPRRFSYSRENHRASRSYGMRPASVPFGFVAGAKSDGIEDASRVEPRILEIELQELTELWLNPSRHYCRKVLQLAIDYETRPLEEAEPFGVDFLERYRVNQWLLARRLNAETTGASELELLRERGELPFAGLGEASYARLARQVDRFVETLPSYRPLEPIQIEVRGEGWRLTGRLDELTDVGMLRFRCANLKPKDLLRAWVAHVARNAWEARKPSGLPLTTHVVGTDRSIRFGSLAAPDEILENLTAGYRQGLERPLPVFERASHAYAEQRRKLADTKGRSRTPPIAAARRAWTGDRFPGDAEEPYVALCFRDTDPLATDGFAAWAERLWGPLLEHAEEIATT